MKVQAWKLWLPLCADGRGLGEAWVTRTPTPRPRGGDKNTPPPPPPPRRQEEKAEAEWGAPPGPRAGRAGKGDRGAVAARVVRQVAPHRGGLPDEGEVLGNPADTRGR